MKAIKFTEKYLERVFEDNFIEDDELYDCLKGRTGTIEESNESFKGYPKDMVLSIKLKMMEC